MGSLTRIGSFNRPRTKGPKPLRASNHPDKHHRSSSRWVDGKKREARAKLSVVELLEEGVAVQTCVIDGVRYRYTDLPFSMTILDEMNPREIIRRMEPHVRENFGIVALVDDEAVRVLDGVRKEVATVVEDVEEGSVSVEGGEKFKPKQSKGPKVKPQPKVQPLRNTSPTLNRIRKELLDLLLLAQEKREAAVMKGVGEGRSTKRLSALGRGERKRLRALKTAYRNAIARARKPRVIGRMSAAEWIDHLTEEREAA